jgi:uncharacterized protein with von Willebrand factor type A (vWA) domain
MNRATTTFFKINLYLTLSEIYWGVGKQHLCFPSNGIKTINLLDLANSMDLLIDFLLMSFHGGTDAAPALIEAINMLQTKDYKEAGVLMISDFVMFELREDIVKKIRQEQSKDTRFHSLTISKQANPEIVYLIIIGNTTPNRERL